MAPLDGHRTMLDVMMALRLPLILVTGSYPGAVSHTLTALNSLFRRDMNVLATIVNETPGSPIALDDVVASHCAFHRAGDRPAEAPAMTTGAATGKTASAARSPACLRD